MIGRFLTAYGLLHLL